MHEPSSLAEHEQKSAEWGERGPSHAIAHSEEHYDRLTRDIIVLNVKGNVPQEYVEAQKRRTFVVLPPSQYHPNGN